MAEPRELARVRLRRLLVAGARALLQALDARVAPWREQVVQPLRAVRRRMKEAALGPEPEVQESLRNQVKKLELAAEKAQHGVLEAAAITAAATAPPA